MTNATETKTATELREELGTEFGTAVDAAKTLISAIWTIGNLIYALGQSAHAAYTEWHATDEVQENLQKVEAVTTPIYNQMEKAAAWVWKRIQPQYDAALVWKDQVIESINQNFKSAQQAELEESLENLNL